MLLKLLIEDMAVEAKLKSKLLYKFELYLVKMIPIIIAVLSLLNATLSYFDIDCNIFSYLGGVSVLTIILLYVSSIVFRFCAWHRMTIHYITANWLISIIDYHHPLPFSDRGMLMIYIILAAVSLLSILYLKFRK